MIASLAEMAGYLLAATSFLALAATLKRGAHIRVTMLLGALPPRARFLFELWAFVGGERVRRVHDMERGAAGLGLDPLQ